MTSDNRARRLRRSVAWKWQNLRLVRAYIERAGRVVRPDPAEVFGQGLSLAERAQTFSKSINAFYAARS
jgi:hypothetical protein